MKRYSLSLKYVCPVSRVVSGNPVLWAIHPSSHWWSNDVLNAEEPKQD